MTFSIKNTTINISTDEKCECNKWTHNLSTLNKPCTNTAKFQYESGRKVCSSCKNIQEKFIQIGVQHYSGIHGGTCGYTNNICWRQQERQLTKYWKATVKFNREHKGEDFEDYYVINKNLNTLPFDPILAKDFKITYEMKSNENALIYMLGSKKAFRDKSEGKLGVIDFTDEEIEGGIQSRISRDENQKVLKAKKIKRINAESEQKQKEDNERYIKQYPDYNENHTTDTILRIMREERWLKEEKQKKEKEDFENQKKEKEDFEKMKRINDEKIEYDNRIRYEEMREQKEKIESQHQLIREQKEKIESLEKILKEENKMSSGQLLKKEMKEAQIIQEAELDLFINGSDSDSEIEYE